MESYEGGASSSKSGSPLEEDGGGEPSDARPGGEEGSSEMESCLEGRGSVWGGLEM